MNDLIEREGFRLASIWSRFFAFVIDDILISVVFLIIYLNAFLGTNGDIESISALTRELMVQYFALRVVYQWLFVAMYGATFGKMILKIRVISVDLADNPSYFHSFIRAFLRVGGELIFYITYMTAFFSARKETIHDKFAKTIVVIND